MSYVDFAKEVFDIESKAIMGLSTLLDENFTRSIEAILVTNNRTSLPFDKMKKHVIDFESWDPLEFQNIVSLDKGSIVLAAELDYLLSIDRFCNQILEPSSEL